MCIQAFVLFTTIAVFQLSCKNESGESEGATNESSSAGGSSETEPTDVFRATLERLNKETVVIHADEQAIFRVPAFSGQDAIKGAEIAIQYAGDSQISGDFQSITAYQISVTDVGGNQIPEGSFFNQTEFVFELSEEQWNDLSEDQRNNLNVLIKSLPDGEELVVRITFEGPNIPATVFVPSSFYEGDSSEFLLQIISGYAPVSFTFIDLEVFDKTLADIDEDAKFSVQLPFSGGKSLPTSCAVTSLVELTIAEACSCSVSNCSVTLQSSANYNGSVSFSFTLTNDEQTSAPATISATVTAVNDAPTLSDSAVAANVGQTVVVSSSQLDASDVDGTDETLIYTVTSVPSHGNLRNSAVTLTVNDTFTHADVVANNISYEHTGGDDTDDSFAISLRDEANTYASSATAGSPLVVSVLISAALSGNTVAMGSGHTCAILDNDDLKCWGLNDRGQLGLGNTNNRGDSANEMGDSLPPIDLGAAFTPVSVTAGGNHTCALSSAGDVKCWGSNSYGQLGQGNTNDIGDGNSEMGDNLDPVDLGTGRTATSISAGGQVTCALLDNAQVKCWGYGINGSLGQGNSNHIGDAGSEMGDDLDPIDLGTGRTAKSIEVGGVHACAILDNDDLKCWGANQYGTLGQEDTNTRGTGSNQMGDSLLPIDLGSSRKTVSIGPGSAHNCVLLDNDTVKCWGYNSQQSWWTILGLGTDQELGDNANEMGDYLATISLGSGRTATQIAVGFNHNCAILDNGDLKCWGNNDAGELGYGDTNGRGDSLAVMGDSLLPVDLGSGLSAVRIVLGGSRSCAVLNTNELKCWGSGTTGSMGTANTSNIGDSGSQMGDNFNPINLGAGRTIKN